MSARARGPLHPERFPRLTEFLSGYLHEDFALEHETPEGALKAFLRDANDEERGALLNELERFRAAASDASWADVRAAFASLGGAWRPRSRAVLDDLLQVPTRLSTLAHRNRR